MFGVSEVKVLFVDRKNGNGVSELNTSAWRWNHCFVVEALLVDIILY